MNFARDLLRFVVVAFAMGGCGPRRAIEGAVDRVTLSAFGFFGGSFEWGADSETLTSVQREKLADLRLIPAKYECWADIMEYRLALTETDGTEVLASTNSENAACGDEKTLIEVASLEPLLDTLTCLATGQERDDLGAAPTVRPNDGCRHGFFVFGEQLSSWVKIETRGAGAHTIEVTDCRGAETALELYDAAGTVLIASDAASGGEGEPCAQLVQTLTADATYALRITRERVTQGGHVNLEVRAE